MSDIAGRHSVVVTAPRARCVDLLLDLERYPTWYDTLDRVSVLERGENGTPALVELSAAAGPLGMVTLTVSLTYELPARIDAVQVGGDGRVVDLRQRWLLEEAAADTTAVSHELSANAGRRSARLALRAARPLAARGLVRGPAEGLKRAAERR